ncbi:RNA polymerase II C-terminal domain kinase beta subunit [Balamuthia mandrillaris]
MEGGDEMFAVRPETLLRATTDKSTEHSSISLGQEASEENATHPQPLNDTKKIKSYLDPNNWSEAAQGQRRRPQAAYTRATTPFRLEERAATKKLDPMVPLDADTESLLRYFGCSLIRRCAVLLQVPQVTAATAQVFFHRFYQVQSFKLFDVALVAQSCLYLACKAEESLRKLRDIINCVNCVLYPSSPPLKIGKEYWLIRDEVVACEQILLRSLAFEVAVSHPYKYLLNYLRSLRATPVFAQVAWNLVNDLYYIPLCIDKQYSSPTFACSAIYLASLFLQDTPDALPQLASSLSSSSASPTANGRSSPPPSPSSSDTNNHQQQSNESNQRTRWWEWFDVRLGDMSAVSEAITEALETFRSLPFDVAMDMYNSFIAEYRPPAVLSLVALVAPPPSAAASPSSSRASPSY